MNILVLGGGGREHALAWKLSDSPKCEKLYVAPGNAGTAALGTNIDLNPTDFKALEDFCLKQGINLVVVGPEAPLVAGIVDYFKQTKTLKSVAIIGPDKNAAQLEGSKRIAKEFMQKHSIPTAAYKSFTAKEEAAGHAFLETLKPPFVLKADGLAGGKGVVILNHLAEAKAELTEMLSGKFGEASTEVVIEEFLDGQEFSVFALTDGKDYKILPIAKDYKRIGEGDTGLNTGGMGAVSPVAFADEVLMQKVKNKIVEPTVKGLAAADDYYRGFVFFGLIVVNNQPYVIEYNVRLGDPETEVVLPRINSDLVDLLEATANQTLGRQSIAIDPNYACTVMAVAEGYPGNYPKGQEITGLADVDNTEVITFHAGTKLQEGKVLTNGGRVITFTGRGKTQKEALQHSYKALKTICYHGITYRSDIGYDL